MCLVYWKGVNSFQDCNDLGLKEMGNKFWDQNLKVHLVNIKYGGFLIIIFSPQQLLHLLEDGNILYKI